MPFPTTPTEALAWGILIHLICDFVFQNHWIAKHKSERRVRRALQPPVSYFDGIQSAEFNAPVPSPWWDRHPAAYVHAGIHGVAFLLIFPPWAAATLAVLHFLIDLRRPLEWWAKLIRQTDTEVGLQKIYPLNANPRDLEGLGVYGVTPCFGMGLLVRVWTDQTFHLAVVGGLALLAY